MIVTTGAAGQLGRLVTQELAVRTAPSGVRLTTRDPARLADVSGRGFALARADYDDAASLDAAFAGADVLLITSSDGPNGIRMRQHRAAIDAAVRARVGRVVYTSFSNPSATSPCGFNRVHADSEAYLEASGLPFTILRNNQYAENLGGTLAQAKAGQPLVLPGAGGKVGYIRRVDAAAAIAGALTQGGHAGRTYDITGPESVDLHAIAAVLSKALGRPVPVIEADPAEFAKVLASFGLPPFLVEGLIGMYAAAAAGAYDVVTDDAARLAGRPVEAMTRHALQFA